MTGNWTGPLVGALANGLLAAGSYGIAGYGLGQPRGLPRLLGAGVIFWTAITVGLEGLGAFGAIGLYPVLAWAGMIFVVGLGVKWRRAVGVPEVPDDLREEASLGWDALLVLSLVLTAAILLAIPSLLLAVKVVSDGPIYHLYFAARWWKAGRLILVAAPFGENAATYFPANGDLWFTWLMVSWGGESLAKIGQAPFLLLAGASAYGCARSLGISRSASLIATCWFVSSIPLFLFSFEPNVDTIFVAGYLLSAYFFLRFARGEGKTSALVLGALAAGEAIGTKAVGVVFVPPLIVLMLATIEFQSVPRRSKLIRTLAVVLAPAVTGGYWFGRNLVLTGNPLYPLEVRWMGQTLLAGWYGPDAMRTSPYYLPIGDWRALGDILLAVLDPRLAPIWLASVAGAWAVKNPKVRESGRWIAVFSILAVLNIALYWFVIPYRTQQRFMLQALGLAVVPLAATLDRGRWLRYAGTLLLAAHVLTPESWPFPAREDAIPWDLSPVIPNAMGALVPLFPGREPGPRARSGSVPMIQLTTVGVILLAGIMVWAWSRGGATTLQRWPRQRWALATTATAGFLLLAFFHVGTGAFEPRIRFYDPRFRDYYVGWLNFETRCGPAGTRVAYAGTDLPYYLLGQGLRNEVRYINIDGHRDWLLHDYHREALSHGKGTWPNSRPGWDRLQRDYRAWLSNLDAEGIQLLVVTRANPDEGPHNIADAEGFPIEKVWADSHPERFQPLYGRDERDPLFRIYRVRRP
ncbi:MAG: glycosyltransferase family 39 protein [Isosphaeraceae bacterium]